LLLTITTISEGVFGNVLAVANNATDGRYAPRLAPVTTANVAITDAHDRIPLGGKVTVSVAQADALTACVTAHIRYEKAR
jgi:hypothetical protein